MGAGLPPSTQHESHSWPQGNPPSDSANSERALGSDSAAGSSTELSPRSPTRLGLVFFAPASLAGRSRSGSRVLPRPEGDAVATERLEVPLAAGQHEHLVALRRVPQRLEQTHE